MNLHCRYTLVIRNISTSRTFETTSTYFLFLLFGLLSGYINRGYMTVIPNNNKKKRMLKLRTNT